MIYRGDIMIKVGILGATGYAGQQLVWILRNHPQCEIVFLNSHNYAKARYDEIYNNYYELIEDSCINMEESISKLSLIDVLFIALPHGKSFDIVKKALAKGIKVIDLGADYRLKSAEVYKKWYGLEHEYKEMLKNSSYGLVELNRENIKKSSLIANPGCYPTASILSLAPLLKLGMINPETIIIDAKSGITGAGRTANISNLFTECNDSVKAYGVGSHRHTPEIEQELSSISGENIILSFTPHLIPMNRGILTTCYAKLNQQIDSEELKGIYKSFYKDDYFVKITEKLPETRWVRGSNFCHIGVSVDNRTNRAVIVTAIDNLIKGAAGQAVQNMNVMLNLKETEGLEFISMAI